MTGCDAGVFRFDSYESPVGPLTLATDEQDRLRILEFDGCEDRMRLLMRRQNGACASIEGRAPPAVRDALDRYFAGEFAALDALGTATGGTPFQKRVWAALRDIPPGRTETYGALASRLGLPKAMRAVGLANGANPIAIVVPCHRVIGADGSLTGFGGGIARKQWLLSHERAAFRAPRVPAIEARLPGL